MIQLELTISGFTTPIQLSALPSFLSSFLPFFPSSCPYPPSNLTSTTSERANFHRVRSSSRHSQLNSFSLRSSHHHPTACDSKVTMRHKALFSLLWAIISAALISATPSHFGLDSNNTIALVQRTTSTSSKLDARQVANDFNCVTWTDGHGDLKWYVTSYPS